MQKKLKLFNYNSIVKNLLMWDLKKIKVYIFGGVVECSLYIPY